MSPDRETPRLKHPRLAALEKKKFDIVFEIVFEIVSAKLRKGAGEKLSGN